MKALLVAEDDNTINAILPALRETGAEPIVYRWLLKALDNVEEIAPDVVILSTAEYPRHWKTFVQFTKSGIGGVIPKVILYNARAMDNAEKEKARSLGVFGMFGSLDAAGIEELKNYLNGKSGPSYGVMFGGAKIEFVFTNPKSDCLVTGSVRKYSNGRIEFESDIPALVKNIGAGDTIERATFGENKIYKHVGAKVLSNGKTLELKLT